jgi:hypothetical protein
MLPMNEQLGKALIVSGLVLAVIGVIFLFGKGIPLGKLPGDITIQKGNFTFYFPIVTCAVISIIVTVVFFIIGKR